ncbi:MULTISPECIES: hypothetical protein [unclassified Alteromonas]|uniref:hypothetical protein n=1 Tax=unclassified Alteromonas TaxID=2614992 RepID=UPI0005097876|nr:MULTISPECIES: hypothetical protein [unclassified Alteromonas]
MSLRSFTQFCFVVLLISVVTLVFSGPALAFFEKEQAELGATGCNDPKYKQFVEERLDYFERKNKRMLNRTQRDYERSSQANSNPYQVIGDLSRHLIYSAQFESVPTVNAKIDLMFQHGERLSRDQQIAGNVFDNFSTEAHFVGIARAWVAYRQGRNQEAFNELLTSIDVSNSAVMESFGPDFTFIRRIYRDGHTKPVVAYINKTKDFWTGKRADALRFAWLTMIEQGCAIQFDSLDTIKFAELGLLAK